MSNRLHHFVSLTLLTCTLAWLLPALLIAATEDDLAKSVSRLQQNYQQLHSLRFTFNQVTTTSGRERRGSGNAVFYRPDRGETGKTPVEKGIIRWNYTEPEPQVILNDGQQLSIYTKGDRQVLITSAEEMESDVTYAFFSGSKDLLDEFSPMAPDPRFIFNMAQVKLEAIQLIPRTPHPQIKSVQLWYDENYLIHRLLFEDHFDAVTTLMFSEVELNTLDTKDNGLLQDLLDLNLAPDTEIIRQ